MLSQEYSDLEVRSQSSYEGKETAHKGRNKPLPYPGLPQVSHDADNMPEPHWIIGKSPNQAELNGSASHDFTSLLEGKKVARTRYRCGMTNRLFWVCVAVSLVGLAMIIAGAVTGVLKNPRHHSPSTLPQAHLNISDQFVTDEGALALNAREGTPLAVAATPWPAGVGAPWDASLAFAVTLFYFEDINNQIRLLWSGAGNLSVWQEGGDWNEVAISSVPETSQLAAVGYYCASGCQNSMCVAFQGDDATVQSSCSHAFGEFSTPTSVTTASPNSSLALIPFAANYGFNVTYDSELAIFFVDNIDVNTVVFNHGNDGAGDGTSTTTMTSQTQFNGTIPQIAASASNALANILAVSLTGDGNVTASWFEPATQWNAKQPSSFVNEGGNASSSRPNIRLETIAMDGDHRLYGAVADGTAIVEYLWSPADPYNFVWMSSIELV